MHLKGPPKDLLRMHPGYRTACEQWKSLLIPCVTHMMGAHSLCCLDTRADTISTRNRKPVLVKRTILGAGKQGGFSGVTDGVCSFCLVGRAFVGIHQCSGCAASAGSVGAGCEAGSGPWKWEAASPDPAGRRMPDHWAARELLC